MSKLTKRLTALLLSGMLVIGSAPVGGFAAELGQTSETAVEEAAAEEAVATDEVAEEQGLTGATDAPAEEYYTVTLDANGGYFANEWDDAAGDYVKNTEVLNKNIPVGGIIETVPVKESAAFLGWSIELDGEVLGLEYVPVDNCVLYAVWQVADESTGMADTEQETDADYDDGEAVEETESAQQYNDGEAFEETEVEEARSGDTESAEETRFAEDAETAPDEYTVPETDNEQETVPEREVIYLDEKEEKTSEEPVDASVVESLEEETVKGDVSNGIVDSGSCGENLTWTLDEEGTLIISGTGEMEDYTDPNALPSSYVAPWDIHDSSIKNVVIKNGVKTIGNYAFFAELCIEKVSLPNNLVSIGNHAFASCVDLYEIELPSSVTSIGYYAFDNCRCLKTITIPDGVTSIEEGVFEDCDNLTSINIPSSITKIENNAFSDCSQLTRITIPNGVTSIGDYAFSNCSSLTRMIIPNGVTSIEKGTFSYCSGLTSVTIPNGVTSIGSYAFGYCSSLTGITLPAGVTSMGDFVFDGCSNLTSITIPNGVTSIGKWTFCNCSQLTSITIPNGVTSIGDYAFGYCNSLTSIYFNGNAPSISWSAFIDTNATAYYPANDPTWTEDERKKYGGTITWVPWNPGTDPTVTPDPDSFSLSIGTPACNAIVLGEDGMLSAVAWYDFNNQDTALEEAKNIKWTCSDSAAVEIYDPVYDLETKDVRISLGLRGKKPGSYTITGTAPDGRTASADVVVEPKIVAVSDGVTITETTDVELVKATLDTGDKEYLTNFLNSITCKFKQDISTFPIPSDDSIRTEVSDDGKNGKLIYRMTPIYGGNGEFTFTSPGGQWVVEKVYSGLNDYPWHQQRNRVIYYNDKERCSIDFDYGIDDCLDENASIYNPKLAYLLIALATSAYQGENSFQLLEDREKDGFPNLLAVTESLRNLGFSAENEDILEKNYYFDAYNPEYEEDTTAFTIATKMTTEGDRVVTIVVRGSYGGFGELFFRLNPKKWASDWRGNVNFKNYDVGLHEGFSIAAEEIIDELNTFLSKKNIDKSQTKFVITGHSRGAAVANLVSKKLIDSGVDKEKVYDYNFACPDTGRDYDGKWNIKHKYDSIYNVNNVKDIVGVIPGVLFHGALNILSSSNYGLFSKLFSNESEDGLLFWGKYGNTYFFSKNWGTVEGTDIGNPEIEHQPTLYLDYLSKEPSEISFKSWTEARALLMSNIADELNPVKAIGKIIGIYCPVDVEILDPSGELVAEIKKGEQKYYNDSFGKVSILTADDQCIIYISDDCYSVTMKATDTGFLNYVVLDIAEDDNTKLKTYENIELHEGKTICNRFNSDESSDDSQLFVIDQDGTPTKIILSDGTEEEISQNVVDFGSCGDNIRWAFLNDGTLSFTGTGEMTDYPYMSAAPWYSRTVKNVVIGDGITHIGNYAFYDSEMISISLPESLESIGCFAFSGLTGLDTINIPRGVTSIDQGAFAGSSYKTSKITSIIVDENNSTYSENNGVVYSKDGRILVAYPPGRLGEFSVPEGVQVIGDSAFSGCKGVTGMSIPESVITIEDLAFAASGLSDITIPNKVQSIGESAFANCRELKTVSIEGSVKTLKQLTFNVCYNLQTIYLPESIEKIEQNTFFDCRSLKDVYFSGSERTWSKVVIEHGKVYDTFIVDATVHFAKENETIVLDESSVSININDQIWTGKPLTPKVVVIFDSEIIIEGTDYEVSYADNTNVGTATVTITGIGDYEGTVTENFSIAPASINNASVTGISNKTYTGSALSQNLIVKIEGKTLTNDTDYTLSYSNNKDAGTATINITGKGNYTGTKTVTFKINKAEQTITIKTSASSVTVGKTVTVSIFGAKGKKSYTWLKADTDTGAVTVDSSTGKVKGTKVGIVTIKATSKATDNFNAATKKVRIKVVPAATASVKADNLATGIKLTWKKVTGATGYLVYRGSTKIATIKSASTVTYTDKKANTNGTKYTFKIVPMSSYGNGPAKSLTTYRIARPTINSVTSSASKRMTVKWGKNSKASGYQIHYCTDKTFKSGNKSVSIKSAGTVAKVIASLTKGKTYYVRIRTYKTVGSTKYFSAWSQVKSVKISK